MDDHLEGGEGKGEDKGGKKKKAKFGKIFASKGSEQQQQQQQVKEDSPVQSPVTKEAPVSLPKLPDVLLCNTLGYACSGIHRVP